MMMLSFLLSVLLCSLHVHDRDRSQKGYNYRAGLADVGIIAMLNLGRVSASDQDNNYNCD